MKFRFRWRPKPKWAEPLSYVDWLNEMDLAHDVTPPHMDSIYKRRMAYERYVQGFKRS